MKEILFYYDLVCPYAYMASLKVEALAQRTGARLVYKPVLLGGIYNNIGRPQEADAGQSPARVAMGGLRLLRQAHDAGVELNFPQGHPRRTVNAMRLLVAADEATRPALTRALYRTYWQEGRDVSDPAVLAEVATAHGMDPSIVSQPEVKKALFDAVDEAVERGLFGVPTYVVEDQLWWGGDREHLVEIALGGTPRYEASDGGAIGSGRTIEFFHDFGSPYSYLGATQIARVAAENGAKLVYRPMVLGGLFKTIGTATIPMQTFTDPKRRWYVNDMLHWSTFWGVPYTFANSFPLRTITASRVALADPATTDCIYKAAWADDRNIGDKAVLSQVLTEAGFDAEALLEKTQDPAIKAELFTNTDRAASLGACGAPTFVIDGKVVVWGQDRLDEVARMLRGELPPAGIHQP
jgi:2-hydroxychromene-2-carboxylate isomerase